MRPCLLNYKILMDDEIKHVIAANHRLEVKLMMINSLAKVETGFSDNELLRSHIGSKSVY